MKTTESFIELDSSCITNITSEPEVMQHIQELIQQYEKIIQLADDDDYLDISEEYHPRYAWDNPIGLVLL